MKPNDILERLINAREYLTKVQIQGIGDEQNMKAALRILDYLIRMTRPDNSTLT